MEIIIVVVVVVVVEVEVEAQSATTRTSIRAQTQTCRAQNPHTTSPDVKREPDSGIHITYYSKVYAIRLLAHSLFYSLVCR
jgi:hypothetical protein